MSRQKATNYFSHDSNARNDEKLLNLRMHKGAAGYGVYFMLLERLREDANYMSVRDYNILAFDLRVDSQLIKSVVEDFGLFAFTEDGKYFYSESFNRRMKEKDEKKKLLSEAGKRGNERRWGVSILSGGDTQTSGGDCLPMQKLSQQSKEKKEKKGERDIIAPAHDNVNELYLEKFFNTSNEKIEALLISLGLSPGDKDTLRKVADEVINEWDISETHHIGGYQDWSSHLISLIRIKLQKNKPTAAEKKEALAKKAREEHEREQAEQSRKRDEMYRTSVSHEEAKKTEEYRRALEEK